MKDYNISGNHNYQNVTAAYAVLKLLNINFDLDNLKRFKWLEHRQEIYAKVNQTTYVNDSKATNLESCFSAIKSFAQGKIFF